MAASTVASFCVFQPNTVSCWRAVCRFANVLSSDRTRLRRSTATSHCHTRTASRLTQEDQRSSIPVDKLKIRYSRSSGAGGQHVNKVSSKAEVRFHVQTADWIPDDVKREILLKNKTRINKAGEVIVTSEISRTQQRNLEDCLQKILGMIAEASKRPAEPTAEDIALRARRSDQRNLERLKQKKIHAATKQARRVDFD